MSLFEFTFGLSAVILGLALAHMASTVSRLALAGGRVRWAPEPLLLAAIIVLPDPVPEEGPVDLYAHYDRTRALTYGALIVGLLAFWGAGLVAWGSGAYPEMGPMTPWTVAQSSPWAFCLAYGLLIVARWRWLNIVMLAAGLIYYGWEVVPEKLTG